jgi:hypothetical protein
LLGRVAPGDAEHLLDHQLQGSREEHGGLVINLAVARALAQPGFDGAEGETARTFSHCGEFFLNFRQSQQNQQAECRA